ncbi:hypothetical protein SK128_027399 [Halocaridina rubra]|uniref:Uncharacterized protein n=1 Tax=Halocaridina rubra TaxID=373956 RepID=A0AAN8WFW0_HALRR
MNLRKNRFPLILEGNNFRCDNRLAWMFSLRNTTKSLSVRVNLELVICYLEVGTLPPRLEGETVTHSYETTTLGIGPMTLLFALHEHELQDPMMRWMQTADPECEEEEEHTHGADTEVADITEKTTVAEVEPKERKRGRGRGRKKGDRNKAQNDRPIVPLETVTEAQDEKVIAVAPAPVQEESRSYDSTPSKAVSTLFQSYWALGLALIVLSLQ